MTTEKKARGLTLEQRREIIEALLVIPWWNLHDAATYTGKGYRFLLNEVHHGKLKAARVGRRRELLTCKAWVDQWVNEHTAMVVVQPMRRRA